MATASEACMKVTKGRIDNGADEMRLIVRNMNRARESFNSEYTSEELLQLYRMQWASGWDISPDQWTPRQVREALAGRAPQWDENEQPRYAPSGDGLVRSLCCDAEVTTQHEATETMSEDIDVCTACGEECATDD
jgi:hypothetical protein